MTDLLGAHQATETALLRIEQRAAEREDRGVSAGGGYLLGEREVLAVGQAHVLHRSRRRRRPTGVRGDCGEPLTQLVMSASGVDLTLGEHMPISGCHRRDRVRRPGAGSTDRAVLADTATDLVADRSAVAAATADNAVRVRVRCDSDRHTRILLDRVVVDVDRLRLRLEELVDTFAGGIGRGLHLDTAVRERLHGDADVLELLLRLIRDRRNGDRLVVRSLIELILDQEDLLLDVVGADRHELHGLLRRQQTHLLHERVDVDTSRASTLCGLHEPVVDALRRDDRRLAGLILRLAVLDRILVRRGRRRVHRVLHIVDRRRQRASRIGIDTHTTCRLIDDVPVPAGGVGGSLPQFWQLLHRGEALPAGGVDRFRAAGKHVERVLECLRLITGRCRLVTEHLHRLRESARRRVGRLQRRRLLLGLFLRLRQIIVGLAELLAELHSVLTGTVERLRERLDAEVAHTGNLDLLDGILVAAQRSRQDVRRHSTTLEALLILTPRAGRGDRLLHLIIESLVHRGDLSDITASSLRVLLIGDAEVLARGQQVIRVGLLVAVLLTAQVRLDLRLPGTTERASLGVDRPDQSVDDVLVTSGLLGGLLLLLRVEAQRNRCAAERETERATHRRDQPTRTNFHGGRATCGQTSGSAEPGCVGRCRLERLADRREVAGTLRHRPHRPRQPRDRLPRSSSASADLRNLIGEAASSSDRRDRRRAIGSQRLLRP